MIQQTFFYTIQEEKRSFLHNNKELLYALFITFV